MNYSKKTISELKAICKKSNLECLSQKMNKETAPYSLINETPDNIRPKGTNSSQMWYKIPEISKTDFATCCKDIYKVLEGKHKSKSTEDPFLKAVMLGNYGMSEEQWRQAELVRLNQKVLEMKMGDFHEEIMGKFPGYETLPTGHSTGCDVMKKDKTEVFEVKNRHNTVKGSDGKHIITLLKNHKDAGMNTIFVQINCPNGIVNRYGASSSELSIWNGNEIYTYLSGRESFFDDLLLTVQYTFANYKTFDALKLVLEIV